MDDTPEVVDGEFTEDEKGDMALAVDQEQAIIQLTRANAREVSMATVTALEILHQGVLPPSAIRTRDGAGGDTFAYLDHVYVTRLMNAAFGWLWSYDILHVMTNGDGSATALGKITLKIPVMPRADGNGYIFEIRSITEVGAFESYTKSRTNPKSKLVEPVIDPYTGRPAFTMSEADRQASAASRALVKGVARGWNLGLELIKNTAEIKLDPATAWRSLRRNGYRLGLSVNQVTQIGKDLGITTKEELVKNFSEYYRMLYIAGKNQPADQAPFK